jgi:hypothetical protein
MKKQLRVYVGFCDGKPHKRTMHAFPQSGYEEHGYAIYRTRTEARRFYEDVRPMLLVPEKRTGLLSGGNV